MDGDDALEVRGLSALMRQDPLRRRLRPWVPMAGPQPDEMELAVGCNGREYRIYLAGTEEAAARIGMRRPDRAWSGWAVKVVRVQGEPNPRGGGQGLLPVPTLEAAIVGALTAVFSLERTFEERERRIREHAENRGDQQ